jgi:hypothetical protein
MKIFHAITDAEIVPVFYDKTGIKPNILISYAYQEGNISKLVKTYRSMIGSLYLDSGAFSVFTGASKMDVREYAAFLNRYGDHFDACFTMDDRFDDAEHNLDNQLFLEQKLSRKSWKPIPVIHDYLQPVAEFRTYVGLEHKYIALGSLGARKKISRQVLEEIQEKFPKIKIHMFGQLNMKLLEKYRPFSADSAGWAHQAGIGGTVNYWRPADNKRYSYSYGGADSNNAKHIKNSPFWEEIKDFLHKTFKYTYNDLHSYLPRQILNIYATIQFEKYINSMK